MQRLCVQIEDGEISYVQLTCIAVGRSNDVDKCPFVAEVMGSNSDGRRELTTTISPQIESQCEVERTSTWESLRPFERRWKSGKPIFAMTCATFISALQ